MPVDAMRFYSSLQGMKRPLEMGGTDLHRLGIELHEPPQLGDVLDLEAHQRRNLDPASRPAIHEDPRLDGAAGAMRKRLPPDHERLRDRAVV